MLETREEKEIGELVRLMFETELYSMECIEKLNKPVVFSDTFQQRMARLIRRQRRNYKIKTVVKYALSAAAVILLVLCLTNPGYVARAWDVLVKWHSTHLEIDMPDAEEGVIVPEYELTYVPDGFVVTMEEYHETGGVIIYNKDEREVCLIYSMSGGNHNYDNEHSKISAIKDKDGIEILLVEFEDGGCAMLWRTEQRITFSMDADVDKEELFKIKDGIEVKNKEN